MRHDIHLVVNRLEGQIQLIQTVILSQIKKPNEANSQQSEDKELFVFRQ